MGIDKIDYYQQKAKEYFNAWSEQAEEDKKHLYRAKKFAAAGNVKKAQEERFKFFKKRRETKKLYKKHEFYQDKFKER